MHALGRNGSLHQEGWWRIIELFKKGKAFNNFEELVEIYRKGEFDSPRRSTVPFLDYWRSFCCAAQKLEEFIGLKFADHVQLHFEYPVPVQAGKGPASSTDLMVFDSSLAFAIEAKYKEPRYESVSRWIGNGPDTQNRKEVLGGWLSLIEKATEVRLNIHDIGSLPYQLIHRTASVCEVHASSKHVVYQIFDLAKKDYYYELLHTMARLLRESSTLSFWLLLCPFEPLEDYQVILERWDTETPKPKLSSCVKPLLKSRRLARFCEPQLVRCA